MAAYFAGLFFTIRVDRRHARYHEMATPGSRPDSIALSDLSVLPVRFYPPPPQKGKKVPIVHTFVPEI